MRHTSAALGFVFRGSRVAEPDKMDLQSPADRALQQNGRAVGTEDSALTPRVAEGGRKGAAWQIHGRRCHRFEHLLRQTGPATRVGSCILNCSLVRGCCRRLPRKPLATFKAPDERILPRVRGSGLLSKPAKKRCMFSWNVRRAYRTKVTDPIYSQTHATSGRDAVGFCWPKFRSESDSRAVASTRQHP